MKWIKDCALQQNLLWSCSVLRVWLRTHQQRVWAVLLPLPSFLPFLFCTNHLGTPASSLALTSLRLSLTNRGHYQGRGDRRKEGSEYFFHFLPVCFHNSGIICVSPCLLLQLKPSPPWAPLRYCMSSMPLHPKGAGNGFLLVQVSKFLNIFSSCP